MTSHPLTSAPTCPAPALTPVLISPRQLTALLGVNMDTLKRWRQEGIGPAFIRPGEEKGRVAYAIADVEAWINTRRVRTAGAYEVLPLNLTVRTA